MNAVPTGPLCTFANEAHESIRAYDTLLYYDPYTLQLLAIELSQLNAYVL